MKLALTNFSIKHPWLVAGIILLVTVLLAMQFPKVEFDNDPENMLDEDEYIRVFHNRVKEKYSLYDFVIVGIVNDSHANGIFNVGTLNRIYELTGELLSLQKTADNKIQVTRPSSFLGAKKLSLVDLTSKSAWQRGMAQAFRHDPNHLFDEDGNSAVIAREIISPSVVDNIKQADQGSLKLEYLMEKPPTTEGEALTIGTDAMGNPLYNGTLVSEDQKAICIYIPIQKKTYSYNVAALVEKLTEHWPKEDKVFITGQPVAQDTFGVEMLVQMATSAPMAGLAIFLLLLFFFRRVSLIMAPMIIAIVSVVCTMGLLIGNGNKVHIMSSMIAIFLMPIAVADSVHILSEFFDSYHKFNDKAKTIKHVIGHLFRPMLYTSLTTIAGFGSLYFTPIPPVQVFGKYVAFGVALAWALTMTMIPAYIMIAVPRKTLDRLSEKKTKKENEKGMSLFLGRLGNIGFQHWKAVISITIAVFAISIYGITKIRVNDNPVKWFTKSHPIRVADKVLNNHFGGTYTAYLTLEAKRPDHVNCEEKSAIIRSTAQKRFASRLPDATKKFLEELNALAQLYCNVNSSDINKCFLELTQKAEKIDAQALSSWNKIADEINYLDPKSLTYSSLLATIEAAKELGQYEKITLLKGLAAHKNLKGEPLLDATLKICDEYTSLSFKEFVFEMQAELTAPLFKQPEMLRYVENLQKHIHNCSIVGKTSSPVDALKKAAFELNFTAPPSDASEAEMAEYATANESYRSIPKTAAAVGQVFIQLEGMKKKDSLFHLVTKDYQQCNIWVQLKSGDNVDMEAVVTDITDYMSKNKPPIELKAGWAGLTYLNVVWQDKMVKGMISSLISSFVVVFIMMIILFRSPLYGILAMIPLTTTITFIYGLIGHVGKDYDMPVAILSSLTLGLSVDFAIHFLERAREEQKRTGSWQAACRQMFKEPAVAISRNAITISIGFTPLLLAPLVPYKTVGFFLATIMAASWMATLFILPALLTLFQKQVFLEKKED